MTSPSDVKRLDALEKRVAELASLLHYQDSMRVRIEKSIGVIDHQLMKTDAGLHRLERAATKASSSKRSSKASTNATKKPATKAAAKSAMRPARKKNKRGRG